MSKICHECGKRVPEHYVEAHKKFHRVKRIVNSIKKEMRKERESRNPPNNR